MKTPLLVVCVFLNVFGLLAQAADVKPGLYKGVVSVTQTLTESGATLKRSFPVSGRIRDNATFVFMSAPVGISNTMLDGRVFTGTVNLQTALINFMSGTDIDGTSLLGVDLPGTYSGNTLKVTFESTRDLGGVLGMTAVTRKFTLRRVGP